MLSILHSSLMASACHKLVLQTLVTFLSMQILTAQNCNLFREYIGALSNGVKLSDIPINSFIDFHFILAFAIDYTDTTSPSPTNGKFNIFWDNTTLSPSQISSIKQTNPNVKVALSIAGDTVHGVPANFTPSSIDSWVNNAVVSLTSIIQEYNLDGIDIDYEHFSTDTATFAASVGRLITTLKNNGVISFASIAPFEEVNSYYSTLWRDYASVIDYVNFQFYAYDASTNVPQFLSYYDKQSCMYNGGKILASISTGADASGLSPANGFFEACIILKKEGKLPGIFIWSADGSKADGFPYEQEAQTLLASAY
ncbi:putative chitinase [Dioscorea sansibarensis]